jgi:hypothetical protein
MGDAAIVGAPNIDPVFFRAPLSRALTTAGNGKIKLIASEVIASSGDLHDHLLAIDRAGSKCQAN